jgi:hypothetical protein
MSPGAGQKSLEKTKVIGPAGNGIIVHRCPVESLDTTPTELLRCPSSAVGLLSRSVDATVFAATVDARFTETFSFSPSPLQLLCASGTNEQCS